MLMKFNRARNIKRWDISQTFPCFSNFAGTITQLFGAGESEYSVIMLWTYALASIFLTLWSTLFMWLVA
jgi:hypothetical protein